MSKKCYNIVGDTMKKIAIKLILWYQKKTANSAKRCRHYPSCSNYALIAYQKRNFLIASWLTMIRLLKCNPLAKPKYDPVPLSIKELVYLF